MGLPNISALTKVATKSITCILLNQRVLLEIAELQETDPKLKDKITARIRSTDGEVASLKTL